MESMGDVKSVVTRTIDAPPDRVRNALADYETMRPSILTDAYRDYRVEAGGHGAGSRVRWTFQATRSRVRDQLVEVSQAGDALVERDRNSSMVTTWTVTPSGQGSTVTVETTWSGAGGIGGFFERIFAPKGMARIHNGVLDKLAAALRA